MNQGLNIIMALQIEKKKLPSGWVEMTLGEIRIDHSENIEPAKHASNRFELYSVPSFDTQSPEHITGSEIGSSKRTTVPNTVLLCKINPRMNRVWLVGKSNQHSQITSTEWIPFFPVNGVFPKYLLYFLQNPQFRSFAAMNVSGVGGSLMRIKPNTISRYPFPIPPLAEQHRIVAKIEELFSDLDAGVASLKQAQAQLKTYRQAVLKYAFEGKLTAAWRLRHQPEPAEKLLAQINAEREKQNVGATRRVAPTKRNGNTQRPKEFSPLTEAELAELPELPEGWRWVKLEHISNKVTDGEHIRPKTTPSGVYFVSAKDIRENGVSFDDPLFESKNDAEKYRKRCDPARGDILLVSRGATVGRMCIVNTDETFCLLGSVILLKVDTGLESKYLTHILKSPSMQKALLVISGSTAQQAIYLRDIKQLIIPICTLLEQRQIIQEIESRLSVCDKLEESLKESLQKAEALRQSILKKAFAGKLVPQDPNDEPAERLLARIRAEKNKTPTR